MLLKLTAEIAEYRLLGVAFEIARAALKIGEGEEPAKAIIAGKLIEFAKQGERDPERLVERVLALSAGVDRRHTRGRPWARSQRLNLP